VVFLTAYDQFAIRAFEAEALDYLLKPVSEARFAATMQRLRKRLIAPAPDTRGIVVSTPRGEKMIVFDEIDWIEAADNYARLWKKGRSYLLRRSLDQPERAVAANSFVRAHRQAHPHRRRPRAAMGRDRRTGSSAGLRRHRPRLAPPTRPLRRRGAKGVRVGGGLGGVNGCAQVAPDYLQASNARRNTLTALARPGTEGILSDWT
jgi:hypothetical protein